MLRSCGVLLTFSSRTVSALSHSLNVPVSAKLRLCQNIPSTHDLGARLEAAGASWLTLHARHVSARRRRQGAADLSQIKELKSRVGVPVVSNGNVKTWEDVVANRAQTGADGVMVGETLLANPWYVHLDMPRKLACAHRVGMTTSFMNILAPAPAPQPVCEHHSRSCQDLAGVSRHLSGTPGYGDNAHDSDTRSAYRRPPIVCTLSSPYVEVFADWLRSGRRPWYNKFRATLGQCETIDDIERFLRVKVQRWRGLPPLTEEDDDDDAADEDEGSEDATQQDQDG